MITEKNEVRFFYKYPSIPFICIIGVKAMDMVN